MKVITKKDKRFLDDINQLLSHKIEDGVVDQVEACIKTGQDETPSFFLSLDDIGSISLVANLWGDDGVYEAKFPLMQAAKPQDHEDRQEIIKEAEALEAIALHLRNCAELLGSKDMRDDTQEEAYKKAPKDRASISLYCIK